MQKERKIPTKKRVEHLRDIVCELSLLFNKKEGVDGQFPEVVRNLHNEKLWNHLDKRELRDLKSTKTLFDLVLQ